MSPTNKSATDDLNPPPSNAGTTAISHSSPPSFRAAIIDDSSDDDEMPELMSDDDENDMPDLIPTAGTWDNERDSIVDRPLPPPAMIVILDGMDQNHRPLPYLVGHTNVAIDQYFTNYIHRNNNNNQNTQLAPRRN